MNFIKIYSVIFDLHIKLQKHINSKRKDNESDNYKNKVMLFVSSLIGTLQCIELNVLNMVNQFDTSIVESINKIINHLNNSINDLRSKLNQIDLMLNNYQYSSATVADFSVDFERTLGTTYYIAKKNKVKTSIVFNSNIFDAIKQCIVPNIDISDTYVLSNTLNFPSDYKIISSTKKLENYAPVPIRSLSSASNISMSSNYSAKSTGDIKPQRLDHSSIKEITKNEVETVVITHLNSPSDFYLQLRDNIPILKAVSDEVKKFVQKKQSALDECIKMDNVMYAVQLSTNEWCRGVVVHTCNENGINFYTVHCIDYGFTETLTSNKIRKLPASVVSIPSLAYNCTLYDLMPSTTTGWSNEAYQLFRDLITQEKTISFFIYPIETNGDRIEVDVICNGIHPISIRDAMLYLRHGSTENNMTIALREKLLSIITLPGDKILQEEGIYSIIISHLFSPSEFYFRIADDDQSLIEIMKKLEILYKPTEKDTNKNFLLYTPKIGMAVAARYSIDNTWYRAKIISLPEPRMVTIYYIDFGNSETLPWDQLRVLDQSLIKIPPLAIKALLADVYPAIDGIECTNWSDNATGAFFNLVKNYDSMEVNLTAKIILVNNDSHNVVLYNHTSRGEVCVNSKLISHGHAVRLDPGLYSFTKENVRTPLNHNLPKLLHTNSRNKSMMYTTEDTLAFTKPWTIVEDLNHTWTGTKNNKDVPGVEMSIVKVVSPDEITLKLVNYNPERLIECMNNVYKKSKNNKQKTQWQINDLCAVYKKQFGNWYRGKILNLDTKKLTASVSFYDLNLINYGISINSLYELEPNLINIKCGFLHCCMDKLVPLGDSDSKWPKFSCDRLIEELKKYPVVYFSKKGKKDDIALGEIWVKEIQTPEALEPMRERWINMNKFMIEQGFAISNKQNAKQDDEYLTSQSESEFNQTFESLKNDMTADCWLPPITITKSRFNAWVTYVDMNCHVYLQDIDQDSETVQLLRNISEELSSVFSNTQPEPINVKWSEGQMVIVMYHLDKQWYRGTITKIEENGTFSVQFLDYGNTETCSHEDLRSILYMTDIPQLCYKGFFTSILPITENNKWTTDTLDYLHSLIVEQTCMVTVDSSFTHGSSCAISKLTTGKPPKDICQLLVSQGAALFDYASKQVHRISSNSNTTQASEHGKGSGVAAEKSEHGKGSSEKCARVSRYPFMATKVSRNEEDEVASSGVDDQESSVSSIAVTCAEKDECGDDERSTTNNNNDEQSDVETQCAEPEESSGFFSFCLVDTNEVVEGTLCKVISPVRMTLMIKKIGGIDISESKNVMQTDMIKKCAVLPPLDKIVPGTAVVVLDNFLWRRGTIGDDAKSVYLVDFGVSIKLAISKARLCPAELFELPMFAIDCHLANVTKGEDADANDVAEKMSKLLKGVNLKIVGISESANIDETVGVVLYNSTGGIAYQPLIDSGLLIPK